MYQTQHDELFGGLRKGLIINDGMNMANSTMAGIMGRMAAYSGRRVTWEEAVNSTEILMPENTDWGNIKGSGDVPMPGITELS
jgi:hypothetical protein